MRLRAARPILRAYPGIRGRWRLAGLLLAGSPRAWDERLAGRVARAIPDGRVVRCRHGLRVRVRPDAMYVDPYLFGDYEPAETALVRRLVRPGDVAFDVGANFGWYTALLAGLVGPAGEVHAFEPLGDLAALAAETVALSGGRPVELVETALGEEAGTATVYRFPGLPHGHASLSRLGRVDAVPQECALDTLDGYLAGRRIARVDFLKIDVEGHELGVLRGGTRLLGGPDAPVVAFEVNTGCLGHVGVAPAEVFGALRDAGYTAFWEIGTKGGAARVEAPGPRPTADYLAAKPAAAARVERAARA